MCPGLFGMVCECLQRSASDRGSIKKPRLEFGHSPDKLLWEQTSSLPSLVFSPSVKPSLHLSIYLSVHQSIHSFIQQTLDVCSFCVRPQRSFPPPWELRVEWKRQAKIWWSHKHTSKSLKNGTGPGLTLVTRESLSIQVNKDGLSGCWCSGGRGLSMDR
jgi:hypothetical protein